MVPHPVSPVQSTPETPAQRMWREAVLTVAERARHALPRANGRIERAVELVLAGAVELLPDNTAKVASRTTPGKTYVVNGHCDCADAPYAPDGFCQHRTAAGIYKRAMTLATEMVQALDTPQPTAPVSAPEALPATFPEAPASANVYVVVSGRKVQLTLRDTDETRLLARLEALLTRFPVPRTHDTDN